MIQNSAFPCYIYITKSATMPYPVSITSWWKYLMYNYPSNIQENKDVIPFILLSDSVHPPCVIIIILHCSIKFLPGLDSYPV